MKVFDRMSGELHDAHLPRPASVRRQRVWREDTGEEVCIDRLMADKPFWMATQRERRAGPQTITLVTDMATRGSVDPDDVLWRGAAAVALTHILEQAGYRVELWLVRHSRSAFTDGRNGCIALNLKRCGDPVDASALINAVSAWFYRTVYFAAYAASGCEPDSSQGSPASPTAMLPYVTSDQTVMVSTGLWSYSDAVAWIRQQLESFNASNN